MKRPCSITVVAWILIVAGVGAIVADLWPLLTSDSVAQLAKLRADGITDISLAWDTRALAIVGGVNTLLGRNWARWLLAAWMVLHLVISTFHSAGEAAAHCAIFAPLAYLLFRKASAPFFR